MNKLILASLLISLVQVAQAAQPVRSSELSGKYNGISANGPCTLKFKNKGPGTFTIIDQNMSDTYSMLFDADKTARALNKTGELELTEKVSSPSAYDENSISFELLEKQDGARCLNVHVEDVDHSKVHRGSDEWVSQNHCTISLDNRKDPKLCSDSKIVERLKCSGQLTNDTKVEFTIRDYISFDYPHTNRTEGHVKLLITNGMVIPFGCKTNATGWNCDGYDQSGTGYTVQLKKTGTGSAMVGEILQPPTGREPRLIGSLTCK